MYQPMCVCAPPPYVLCLTALVTGYLNILQSYEKEYLLQENSTVVVFSVASKFARPLWPIFHLCSSCSVGNVGSSFSQKCVGLNKQTNIDISGSAALIFDAFLFETYTMTWTFLLKHNSKLVMSLLQNKPAYWCPVPKSIVWKTKQFCK